MKKALQYLVVELIVSMSIAFLVNNKVLNRDFATLAGLCNLIIAVIGFLAGLIVSIVNKEIGRSLLVAAGILFLLGFLTCSAFPMRFNQPVRQ